MTQVGCTKYKPFVSRLGMSFRNIKQGVDNLNKS